jgi:NAD(P)H-flavin reductase
MSWDDYPYRVPSSRLVTPVIRELRLTPDATMLPYRPGQYVLLSDRDYWVPPRSYSLANAPARTGGSACR